jgi:predicted enzyme related to lactoylglutathione lyase
MMSETMSETKGKIAWFEIPAGDTKRAQAFYGGLLGWQFQPFEGQDYYMTYEAGGAIQGSADGKGLIVYFGTDDIEGAVTRVRELGGQSEGPQEIPNIGLYAHCEDTEGNAFGLFQAGG